MAKNGLSHLLSLTALTAFAYAFLMAVMTIRDLDDEVRDKIRIRAAQNKRSMEAEARAILTNAVESVAEMTLIDALCEFGNAMRAEEIELEFPRIPGGVRDPFA